jgi:hypothetical protein
MKAQPQRQQMSKLQAPTDVGGYKVQALLFAGFLNALP